MTEPPLIPAVLTQSGSTLHYEAIFGATSSLLLDTVGCEFDFMMEFFGGTDSFENIFGKSIFLVMESLEQVLVTSWDAIGCMLLLQLNAAQRNLLSARQLPLLSSFFQRVQVLAGLGLASG